MIVFLKALVTTVAKKQPIDSSRLDVRERHNVAEGVTYQVEEILEDEPLGSHIHVKLAYGAGDWWFFKPHVEIISDRIKMPDPSSPLHAERETMIAVDLIAEFEGFRTDAYLCPAGVWTIGYGTIIHPGGTPVKQGDKISESTARGYLVRFVENLSVDIRKIVTVKLDPNELAALISFVYNVGIGAFKNSTLLRLLNTGDRRGAADQLLRWNKAGTKVLAGLTRRREAERTLFLTPFEREDASNEVAYAMFEMDIKQSKTLLYGTFKLRTADHKLVYEAVATSGATGFQHMDAFKARGKGLCPPYEGLVINLKGYYLATKGIEGMFYHVTPDPIPGYGRSQIGVHHDANVPGSAGCIVIKNKTEFVRLSSILGDLARLKPQIPLIIKYS